MTAAMGRWRLEGLDPALAAALAEAMEEHEAALPLTYSDLRLVADLSEISGDRSAQAQALAVALLVARDEGSLCVRLDPDAIQRRLEVVLTSEAARAMAEAVAHRFGAGGVGSPLVGSPTQTNLPLIRYEDPRGVFVYFQAYFLAAVRLRERVQARLGVTEAADGPDWPPILDQVLHHRPQRLAGGEPLVPSEDQVRAVELALRRPFAVISGGPGTGKTSTITAILRCLVRGAIRADEMRVVAPSGRAAQRMTEALQTGLGAIQDPTPADLSLWDLTGSTIHRLLGYNPRTGEFWRGPDDPIEARVIVVDEVSMVDAELMCALLDAALPHARIILLGDKDQLPSVESGAVLADLVPADGSNPAVAMLTTNHRSRSAIREVASAIAAGEAGADTVFDALEPAPVGPGELAALLEGGPPEGGCFLLEEGADDMRLLHRRMDQWVDGIFDADFGSWVRAMEPMDLDAEVHGEAAELADALLRRVESARALTLLRRGPFGAAGMNRRQVRRLGGGATTAYPGMPLLVTRNDAIQGLWNGDVGVVVRGVQGLRALFRKPGGVRAYPVADLPPTSPAYAMTVHKAQGSEYDRVLLVVPPEGGQRLLSREMIYTGLTRAKRLVI
ncbi:MAG: exodeoxyribonuclease V subunit alpha, partial [Armatimonadia bacterium]|nr:exodeoxyribonuclease V subunit alpha [Armatimonadia bacterium]